MPRDNTIIRNSTQATVGGVAELLAENASS